MKVIFGRVTRELKSQTDSDAPNLQENSNE